MVIIIPHTSTPLPAPPASITGSWIAAWNRGGSSARDLEGLRIISIIRLLIPYATFAPRADDAWGARSKGFHDNWMGWGYVNTLDILDDLVADLTLIQPSMSRCVAVDPSSSVLVEADVADHLPGFCRTAQLFLQYALTVARSAELATLRVYNAAAFPLLPADPEPIIIPHISMLLPQPPASPLASHISNWNRGESAPRQLEALRVMIVIWRLLPYVTFTPRTGRGGWDQRPPGFKGENDIGWGYANSLDILDELVTDLASFQPDMSRYTAIDPSSNVAVDADIEHHLPGFCRPAQLLLQYALAVTRGVSLRTVQAYNPTFSPAPNTAIVIPHTSRFLPAPLVSQPASQIAHWNRGGSSTRDLEGLRVVSIIRLLLPYATFAPKADGGWGARSKGFHDNWIGWGWANTLDILDDLVADLVLIQPNMSRCVAIDPSSNVSVDVDVAHHLPGFCRTAQLFLQYALTVARTANLTTIRAYNSTAFPLYRTPSPAPPPLTISRPEETWAARLARLSEQHPEPTSSADRLLIAAEALEFLSSAAQVALVDITRRSQATQPGQNTRPF